MAGPLSLQPISGLAYAVIKTNPEADAAQRHGGAVDPFHQQVGETAEPYPWIEFTGPHGPYGPAESELLSESVESRTPPGGVIQEDPSGDYTPYGPHAGPITKGMPASDRGPEGTATYLVQSYEAHSVRTNAAEKAKASSNPENDPWERFWNPVQGEDLIEPLDHGQVSPAVFGFGVNDHVSNEYHKANSYQFNTSHRLRRYSTNKVPGNWMWMEPAGRPMVKKLAGTARPPIGQGPFLGQDMTATYGLHGAILAGPATEYVAPPEPYVQPTTQQAGFYDSAPAVELW